MRRLIWVVAGLCVVVVGLVVGLKVYFTSERLRGLVVPVLSAALERTVDARTLSLGVWGGLHVSVEGLRIDERAGFGTVPFVAVDEAALSVAFWPLLRGEVAIGEVVLIRPRISVVISAEGEANYADLIEADEAPETSTGAQPLRLDNVRIEDGTVAYTDHKVGTVVHLGGISYGLQMAIAGPERALSGDLRVETLRWQRAGQVDTLDTGTLRLVHRVRSEGDAWVVEALELTWGPLGMTASGRVRSAEDGTHLDLTIHEPQLDLGSKQVREMVGLGVDLSGVASVQTDISGRLNLDVTPPVYPDLSGTVALSGVSVSGKDLPEPVRVDTAAVILAQGALRLETFKGHMFGGIAATGRIEPVWPPGQDRRLQVRLDVRADSVRVPDFDTDTPEENTAPERLPDWIRTVDAELVFAASGLRAGDVDGRDVRLNIKLANGQMQIVELRGKIYDGAVRVSGSLDGRIPNGPFPVRADLEAEGIGLMPLLSGQLDPGYDVDGTVSLSARLSGSLDRVLNPVLQPGSYAVAGQVALTQGKIRTPDLRVPVEALNATVVLAAGDVLTVERLTGRAGLSDFAVTARANGVLAHLLHPDPKVRPNGRLDVSGKMMDLDALFVDPASLPSGVDQTSAVLPLARVADGEATLAFDAVVSDSITYSGFWMHVVAKDSVIRVDSLRARALGGMLTAQAELDARGKTGPVPMRASAAFKDIQANALLKDFMHWNIPLFGQMGTSMTVTGTMDSTLTVIERDLVVDGEAWAAEGRLVNWPLLKTSASFVPQLGFLDFSDLPLRNLHTLFRLEKARVFLKDMNFKTGDVGCGLRGSVGLDETLDVTVDADLPAARLAASAARFGLDRIPGLKLDANTRIPLQIRIGGNATNPRIEAQLQPEVENAVEEKKQELKDKAKDKAKGLLKSLF